MGDVLNQGIDNLYCLFNLAAILVSNLHNLCTMTCLYALLFTLSVV